MSLIRESSENLTKLFASCPRSHLLEFYDIYENDPRMKDLILKEVYKEIWIVDKYEIEKYGDNIEELVNKKNVFCIATSAIPFDASKKIDFDSIDVTNAASSSRYDRVMLDVENIHGSLHRYTEKVHVDYVDNRLMTSVGEFVSNSGHIKSLSLINFFSFTPGDQLKHFSCKTLHSDYQCLDNCSVEEINITIAATGLAGFGALKFPELQKMVCNLASYDVVPFGETVAPTMDSVLAKENVPKLSDLTVVPIEFEQASDFKPYTITLDLPTLEKLSTGFDKSPTFKSKAVMPELTHFECVSCAFEQKIYTICPNLKYFKQIIYDLSISDFNGISTIETLENIKIDSDDDINQFKSLKRLVAIFSTRDSPCKLANLVSLEYFDVKHGLFTSVGELLVNKPKLEVAVIESSDFVNKESVLENLPHLHTFILISNESDNRISIGNKLESLKMCEISKAAKFEGFDNLPNLNHFKLITDTSFEFEVTKFPKSLRYFYVLGCLFDWELLADSNELQVLGLLNPLDVPVKSLKFLSSLTKLESLHLKGGFEKIEGLEQDNKQMWTTLSLNGKFKNVENISSSTLHILTVCSTELFTFDEPSLNLPGLVEIDLSNNKFTSLESSLLEFAPHLETISMCNCQIEKVDLAEFKDLRNLYLDCNPITEIERLTGCEKLLTLSMTSTNIKKLGKFGPFPVLQQLAGITQGKIDAEAVCSTGIENVTIE